MAAEKHLPSIFIRAESLPSKSTQGTTSLQSPLAKLTDKLLSLVSSLLTTVNHLLFFRCTHETTSKTDRRHYSSEGNKTRVFVFKLSSLHCTSLKHGPRNQCVATFFAVWKKQKSRVVTSSTGFVSREVSEELHLRLKKKKKKNLDHTPLWVLFTKSGCKGTFIILSTLPLLKELSKTEKWNESVNTFRKSSLLFEKWSIIPHDCSIWSTSLALSKQQKKQRKNFSVLQHWEASATNWTAGMSLKHRELPSTHFVTLEPISLLSPAFPLPTPPTRLGLNS